MDVTPLEGQQKIYKNEDSKGFLFKIKNKNSETIGYLFGTMHELYKPKPLNEKILKKLHSCKDLYLEINYYDEKVYVNKIKQKNPNLDNESALNLAQIEVSNRKTKNTNPDCTEEMLILCAQQKNMLINSLESFESREFANKKHFRLSQTVESLEKLTIKEVQESVAQAEKNLVDATTRLMEQDSRGAKILINDAYTKVEEAIKTTQLHSGSLTKPLKGEYQIIKDSITKLINKLIKFYGNNSNKIQKLTKLFSQRTNLQNPKTVQQLWENGDKKGFNLLMSRQYQNNVEQQYTKLFQKKCRTRDKFMVNVIHENLLKSTKENRSFYAMGFFHLTYTYENVVERLKKKEWQVNSVWDVSQANRNKNK